MAIRASLVVASLLLKGADAWGADGHSTIAEIAQGLLTEKARSRMLKVLGRSGNLSDVVNWPDAAIFTDEWAWTMPLHFMNGRDKSCWHGEEKGPSNCTFVYERDCTDLDGKNVGFCVVGAIQNFSKHLSDGIKTNLTSNDTLTALKFVAHFVGDIHQPLHCGLLRDRGGNTNMNVTYHVVGRENPHTNLHAVWDTGLIVNHEGHVHHRGRLIRGIKKLLSEDWRAEKKNWEAQMDPKVWAQESLNMATQYAYRLPNGTAIRHNRRENDEIPLHHHLEPYMKEGGIIYRQLATAAVRLASVLDEIFDPRVEHDTMILV